MYFDLTEFLDSLKGLTRADALEAIKNEMDSLDEFHRIGRENKTKHRTFTREHNFLKLLGQEIGSPGKAEIKSADREVVNEVIMGLKPSAPVKVIKKTKKTEETPE